MEARNMNEQKVEDMKALHALRLPQTQTRLSVAQPIPKAQAKGIWSRARAALKTLWNLRARPDLDLESWREIEFKDYREEREPRSRFDRGLWL